MLFLSVNSAGDFDIDRANGVELRLDLFPTIDGAFIRRTIARSQCPVMLTVRSCAHGGKYEGSGPIRERLFRELLDLRPAYFDLEYDLPEELIKTLISSYPNTRFLLSHHDFQGYPRDLEQIFCAMKMHRVHGYKIAAKTRTSNEALKLLLFAKKNRQLSAICMGEEGAFGRVLGAVAGNLVHYACPSNSERTAPGQLNLSELFEKYRFPSLNSETAIYGLIGDPVEQSVGDRYHNAVFQKRNLNAVYVKMKVRAEELAEFFPLAQEMGIRGLSVTAPLKEKVLPFVDELTKDAETIGAVNTLLFQNRKIIGTNTDGAGALDALEQKGSVKGKKIVLLGAGGAARAIAFEAKRRGAAVLVLNRTMSRAEQLAKSIGCEAGQLEKMPESYDFLIHCASDQIPLDPKKIPPEAVAMDVVYSPKETEFLKTAALQGCQLVYGEEMFVRQAARQTSFWLDS